jgi:hypothetical protein
LRNLVTQKIEKSGDAAAGSKEGVKVSDDWKHSRCKDGVGF